jgi:hypothetical protein
VESWNYHPPEVCPENPSHAVDLDKTSCEGTAALDKTTYSKFNEDFSYPSALDKWDIKMTGAGSMATVLTSKSGVCNIFTGTATNDCMRVYKGSLLFNAVNAPYFAASICLENLTNMMVMVGLIMDLDNYIVFRFEDGVWYAENANLGTKTTTALATPADMVWHSLEVDGSIPGNLSYYVDGVYVGNHITNIPVSNLCYEHRIETKENAKKSVFVDYSIASVIRAQSGTIDPDSSNGKTIIAPVLISPSIADTTMDHNYVFVVNELTDDRAIALPLLTTNDTFVFEDHPQTITQKTLGDDLDAGGNKITNLATPSSSNDAATKAYVDGAAGGGGWITNTVTTTDATATTISTISTNSDTTYMIEVTVAARRTDAGSESGGYLLRVLYRNNADTLTKVAQDKLNLEDVSAWDIEANAIGTDVKINVTGQAGKTIEWKCTYRATDI